MSQSEPPYSSESNSRLRTRRPSPSNQSSPRKRQQQIRPARFGPPLLPDRPQSATSTATSIDTTKHPEAKESVGDGSERRGGSILYNSQGS
ncbi:hypothetical protein FOMG_18687 [Fusarium oxysporum f. sp. melonis 26406]|uniref:Uncharacterized protein n=1 Tax=Fusarium oxysporum f. sp. melonis 26406 TaxID=1089452 RepID=W9ZRN4_FUSOX|nr:hypothetical protein FOMG_19456 [Fusarium oxysporum f. sp. melonis 26406]EXK24592.1 hypothetical protein FOMG_18687 [Fusarium oxysporum f. sp. melonis 26406]